MIILELAETLPNYYCKYYTIVFLVFTYYHQSKTVLKQLHKYIQCALAELRQSGKHQIESGAG